MSSCAVPDGNGGLQLTFYDGAVAEISAIFVSRSGLLQDIFCEGSDSHTLEVPYHFTDVWIDFLKQDVATRCSYASEAHLTFVLQAADFLRDEELCSEVTQELADRVVNCKSRRADVISTDSKMPAAAVPRVEVLQEIIQLLPKQLAVSMLHVINGSHKLCAEQLLAALPLQMQDVALAGLFPSALSERRLEWSHSRITADAAHAVLGAAATLSQPLQSLSVSWKDYGETDDHAEKWSEEHTRLTLALLQELSQMTGLKSLTLRSFRFNLESHVLLQQLFRKQLSRLQALSFEDCTFFRASRNSTFGDPLMQPAWAAPNCVHHKNVPSDSQDASLGISALKGLKSLHFTSCTSLTAEVLSGMPALSRLTSLHLSAPFSVPRSGFQAVLASCVADVLAATATSAFPKLPEASGMADLQLCRLELNNADALRIAAGIRQVTSLTSVDLSHNDIGETGLMAISEALQASSSQLQSLNIAELTPLYRQSSNLLVPPQRFVNAAADTLHQLPGLQHFAVSDLWASGNASEQLAFVSAVGACTGLRSLRIEHSKLPAAVCVELGTALRNVPCLTRLELRSIGDQIERCFFGLEALSALQELNLDSNRLFDDEVDRLTLHLTGLCNLTKLSLADNHLISTSSARRFIQRLAGMANLAVVNMAGRTNVVMPELLILWVREDLGPVPVVSPAITKFEFDDVPAAPDADPSIHGMWGSRYVGPAH